MNATAELVLLDTVKVFAITCHDDNKHCAKLQCEVAAQLKAIDAHFDAEIKEAHEAHKAAVARKKEASEPWIFAKEYLSKEAVAWRIKQQEQARIERQRLEDEELARARAERDAAKAFIAAREAEAMAECERLASDADAVIELTGKKDAELEQEYLRQRHALLIAKKQAEAAADQPIIVAPVRMPQLVSNVGQRFRDAWTFEITDAGLIPREFLMPDEKMIGAIVRSRKAKTSIPGVAIKCAKVSF